MARRFSLSARVRSDQERTEEILERSPMARAGGGCAVSSAGAEDTACAICRQRRQNNVRIDHRDDGLHAKRAGEAPGLQAHPLH